MEELSLWARRCGQFGVPLHSDGKTMGGVFNGFNQTLRILSRNDPRALDICQGLVVTGHNQNLIGL